MAKAILVGRHDADNKMGYDEITPRNVLFHLDPIEIDDQLVSLIDEAEAENADLVFQNVPAVLAGALLRYQMHADCPVRVFAVVSKPGPRVAGVTQSFAFHERSTALMAAEAIRYVNSRASVTMDDTETTVLVSVDPVSPFEFVRLERLL